MNKPTNLRINESMNAKELNYFKDPYYCGDEDYHSEMDTVIDPRIYTTRDKWTGELDFEDEWPWGC